MEKETAMERRGQENYGWLLHESLSKMDCETEVSDRVIYYSLG